MNGYLTKVTHPNTALFDQYTYSSYTGQMLTHVDWNGNTTSYDYPPSTLGPALQQAWDGLTDYLAEKLHNALNGKPADPPPPIQSQTQGTEAAPPPPGNGGDKGNKKTEHGQQRADEAREGDHIGKLGTRIGLSPRGARTLIPTLATPLT